MNSNKHVIALACLSLCACTSQNYLDLAKTASARVSAVNGEIDKMAQVSKPAAEERAHFIGLLEEEAKTLQIEANRRIGIWNALGNKQKPQFVQGLIAQSETDAAAFQGLQDQEDTAEADIMKTYGVLVTHDTDLATAAKNLAQLGTQRTAQQEIQFLFGFALDVNTAIAANQAAGKASTATANQASTHKNNVSRIVSSILAQPSQPPAPAPQNQPLGLQRHGTQPLGPQPLSFY